MALATPHSKEKIYRSETSQWTSDFDGSLCWEDNIKIDLRYIRVCMEWINLAQDMYQWRVLVNTSLDLQVPYSVQKFLSE
jgi:hypothetical protein